MPTLLMIHGIGCDASAWDVMKPGFEAAGWTCEAITLFSDRRVRCLLYQSPSPRD